MLVENGATYVAKSYAAGWGILQLISWCALLNECSTINKAMGLTFCC